MESSRERVRKAISHEQPDIVPVNIMGFEDLGPWLSHFAVEDYYQLCRLLGAEVFPDAPAVYRGPAIEPGLDIWHASYSWTGHDGAGYSSGRGGYPLAGVDSVQAVERFRWPDAADFDFAAIHAGLAAVPEDQPLWLRPLYAFPADDVDQTQSARARRAEWVPVLCTLFNLFGLEETLVGMMLNPAVIGAALERIGEFLVDFCTRYIEAADVPAEIFWFGDDFASSRGMLISPEDWRRCLKPVYRRIFGLAKDRGLKVWFHSCGTFRPVLPDLINIGMDVWETAQVHLPGNEPEVLKREYGGDLTFYGAVNSQKTLPHGTPEEVRAEVRERVRVLGRGGGYICGSDHTIMPDVPFENVQALVDEARKFRFV